MTMVRIICMYLELWFSVYLMAVLKLWAGVSPWDVLKTDLKLYLCLVVFTCAPLCSPLFTYIHVTLYVTVFLH